MKHSFFSPWNFGGRTKASQLSVSAATLGETTEDSIALIWGETNVWTRYPTKLGWILTCIYVYVIEVFFFLKKI